MYNFFFTWNWVLQADLVGPSAVSYVAMQRCSCERNSWFSLTPCTWTKKKRSVVSRGPSAFFSLWWRRWRPTAQRRGPDSKFNKTSILIDGETWTQFIPRDKSQNTTNIWGRKWGSEVWIWKLGKNKLVAMRILDSEWYDTASYTKKTE